MIKKNLKTIIITSIVTILPIFAGLILWNKLPDTLPTHWGFSGEIDGWSSKTFAVVFIPLFMLGMHLICTIATSIDPKTEGINNKIFELVLWICPVISIICMTCVYAGGYGIDINIGLVVPLVVGSLFVVIGNYLPKCKQNYTIGIKLPWTLNNEENWNKTHRFSGVIWMVCGVVIVVSSFFKNVTGYATMICLAVMTFAPMLYSYIYYRKRR